MGAVGGYGAFHDVGGADTYRALGTSVASASHTVGAGCGCSGPSAEAVGEITNAGIGSVATTAGVGVMHDAGGADTYISHAIGRAEATAHDAASSAPGKRVASAAASLGTVQTSGLAFGDLAANAYFLDSGASDDTYLNLAESHVEASATAADPATELFEAAGPGEAASLAIGYTTMNGAFAEFHDAGGNDTYTVTASSTPAMPDDALLSTSVMGSAGSGGVAWFVDAGGSDTVSLTPPEPVCEGEERGKGPYWRDCQGNTLGLNL
jgi:hypothetical protein